MDLTNLKIVLSRINQIQNIFNPRADVGSTSQAVSFDNVLKETLNNPFTGAIGAGSTLSALAISSPEKIIAYNGYKMQAQTAVKFQDLEKLITEEFSGKKVTITSTMDGRHSDTNHDSGLAVDFIVEGISKAESKKVEKLCWLAGFKPYNEYLYSSYYKTGDHMHIDLI